MIGYVEFEEAKNFLEVRYSNINEENLKKALYQAFDKIENVGAREGHKTEKNFPRKNDKPKTLELIKRAQILEAYAIITGGNEDIKRLGKGITSKSIGDMSVSYDRSKKIGDITFASVEAAKIMKRFSRRSF